MVQGSNSRAVSPAADLPLVLLERGPEMTRSMSRCHPLPPAAGIITSIHLTSAITDRRDLAGKAVGVWDGYANLLRSTEIAAVPLPWENDADLEAMLERLRSGSLKALLLDE